MTATMPRPGNVTRMRGATPSRSVPTDTGVWYVTGLTDRGPLKPVFYSSLQEFISGHGGRQTYSPLYDAIEDYFREGGNRIAVSRVVGPAAVAASVALDGPTAGGPTSLVVTAKGPGAWANTLRVTVAIVAGGYTLSISDTVLGLLEVSPVLADQNAAVGWSKNSQYVDITLGGEAANPIAVVNAALTAGADDRAAVTDAQWDTAQNRFTADLGPGQVTQVGRTSGIAHNSTRDFAMRTNRVAFNDLPDSPTSATLTGASTAARDGINDSAASFFGPWVVIPGLFANTTRTVPPSASAAAKVSKNDGAGLSPNAPAAAANGVLSYAVDLSQPVYDTGVGIDVTRDDMYSKGVNLIVKRYGVIEIFGWRTASDPNGPNQDWVNLGNARLRMAILARATAIAENYTLSEIDGAGRLFKKFEGDLAAMLLDYWPQSLFGATAAEAFQIDTGPAVNTPATIANRELHASIAVRMSEDSELVVIDFSKIPITQQLVAA